MKRVALISIVLTLALLPCRHAIMAEDGTHRLGKIQFVEEGGKAIYSTGSEGLRKYWNRYLGREWYKTVYVDGTSTKDFQIISDITSETRTLIVTTDADGDNLLINSENDRESFVDVTPTFIKETDNATICRIYSYAEGYGYGHGDSNKVFLSCLGDGAGLYYSPDLCTSWTKVFDGNIDFFTANYKDTLIMVGYTDDEHTTHICISNDDGTTWSELYAKDNTHVTGAIIHPNKHINLMCIYGDSILAITNDDGMTWKDTALPAGTVDIAFQYHNDNELYAAVNGEDGMSLWHSKDMGESWECIYTLQSESLDAIIDMDVYYYDICCLTRSGYVYRFFQWREDEFELLNDFEAMFSELRPIECDIPSTPYYDLMGRPVTNPVRGIYIKDGKKIAVD